MTTRLLRAADVAKILGISKSFAYQLMRRGQITSVRIGRSIRVRTEDLENFVIDNVIQKGGGNLS